MTDHLIDHKYTVTEIERMRELTKALMFPPVWFSRTGAYTAGGSYIPSERAAEIEVQVRTYMMAGVRPEELAELAKQRYQKYEAERRSFPETV